MSYPSSVHLSSQSQQDHYLKNVFISKFMLNLTQQMLTANHLTYQTIMELDNGIRNESTPPHLCIGGDALFGSTQSEEALTLQRYILFISKQFGQSSTCRPLNKTDP